MLLANVIDWPVGSRMTGLSGTPQGAGPGLDGVVSLLLVDLPEGQQGNVEESMAHAFLPFAGTSIHGAYPDGSEWMLLAQIGVVGPSIGFPSADHAVTTFRGHIDRYLHLNPAADIVRETLLDRAGIQVGYRSRGIPERATADWGLDELLAAMVCEMCAVDLDAVVAGRDSGCTFPDMDHLCTGNGFTDVFAQWARGLLFRTPDDYEGEYDDYEDDEDEDEAEDDETNPGDEEVRTLIAPRHFRRPPVDLGPDDTAFDDGLPDDAETTMGETGEVIEIPGPGADLPEIMRFALSYNAYQRFDGPLGTFANGAKGMWVNLGQMPWDLDSLRAALFFEQRRLHHLGTSPSDTDRNYLQALVQAIRNKAGDFLPGPSDPLP